MFIERDGAKVDATSEEGDLPTSLRAPSIPRHLQQCCGNGVARTKLICQAIAVGPDGWLRMILKKYERSAKGRINKMTPWPAADSGIAGALGGCLPNQSCT